MKVSQWGRIVRHRIKRDSCTYGSRGTFTRSVRCHTMHPRGALTSVRRPDRLNGVVGDDSMSIVRPDRLPTPYGALRYRMQ